MLGLPQSTEVKRQLPKAQIYQKFELKASQRDAFDADVSKMEIVNFISPQTVPAISEGNEVKAIFVVDVELKNKEFDPKNVILISKLIPQKIIFQLHFENQTQLAIFHTKLFTGSWFREDQKISLSGLNLDDIWDNFVSQISGLIIEENSDIETSIEKEQRRTDIKKQIESLQKQLKNCNQNRKQLELFHEIKRLKKELKEIK